MYHIIPITSFDEAKKYAPHCDWCICKAEFDYETYTLHGETFYFCLREGFAETPKAVGDNHPLDEYGLSMLAVSVTPDGRLANFTNRWNEDRIGNSIVSEQEISEIIGRDFREVFKPMKDELTEYLNNKYEGKFKEVEHPQSKKDWTDKDWDAYIFNEGVIDFDEAFSELNEFHDNKIGIDPAPDD